MGNKIKSRTRSYSKHKKLGHHFYLYFHDSSQETWDKWVADCLQHKKQKMFIYNFTSPPSVPTRLGPTDNASLSDEHLWHQWCMILSLYTLLIGVLWIPCNTLTLVWWYIVRAWSQLFIFDFFSLINFNITI